MAPASSDTIGLTLLKVGAFVLPNIGRTHLLMNPPHHGQALFRHATTPIGLTNYRLSAFLVG